jgi:hypothetical protein
LTLAGSFEIGLTLALVLRPIRSARPWPMSSPDHRPDRAPPLSHCRSRPGGRAEVVRICDLDGRVWRRLSHGFLRAAAPAGLSATQSAGLSRRSARPRLQHRGELHHERELQAYGGETALSHLSQMVGLTTNNSSFPRRRPRSQSRSFALSRATNCRPSATSGSI